MKQEKNMTILPEQSSALCVLWNGAPLGLQWKILQWLFSTAFLTKTTLLHRGLTKVHWALPTQHLPKIWFIEQFPLNTHMHSGLLCLLRSRYESVLHFSGSFQHYSILSAAFLRPRASCAFVDPPEGGAQDMKNRKGGSYLHPLFQQLFPKLWDSSCFSHHMTSTVMVGFNEQISFRGRFTVRSCTFCVVKLAWTGPAHLLPLFLWLGTIYEASALSFL